jgi:hypothetical protein
MALYCHNYIVGTTFCQYKIHSFDFGLITLMNWILILLKKILGQD